MEAVREKLENFIHNYLKESVKGIEEGQVIEISVDDLRELRKEFESIVNIDSSKSNLENVTFMGIRLKKNNFLPNGDFRVTFFGKEENTPIFTESEVIDLIREFALDADDFDSELVITSPASCYKWITNKIQIKKKQIEEDERNSRF